MGFFSNPLKATKAFVNNPAKIIANEVTRNPATTATVVTTLAGGSPAAATAVGTVVGAVVHK